MVCSRLVLLDVTDSVVKDLESSRLDRKQPSQVRDVYDRLICFQVWSVCVSTACQEVVFCYRTMTSWQVLPDKTVIV